MIGIVDYRMGNLRSVQKALQKHGAATAIVRTADEVDACDKLILPGIGAFADAMTNLREQKLIDAIRGFIESERPFLGVCLGLQLLFDVGEEDGEYEGLGVLAGRVVRFDPADAELKVPQMGWNALRMTRAGNPLYEGVPDGGYVYFVHSYYAAPTDQSVVATTTEYGGAFCSSVWRDNVWATQFHPEKSQLVGLKMLDNFVHNIS